MVWKRATLVPDALLSLLVITITYRPFRVIKSCSVEISVCIRKNDAIELSLYSALSGRVFFSKGDDIKIKRKLSPFFPSFARLSCFHCHPFFILCPFT